MAKRAQLIIPLIAASLGLAMAVPGAAQSAPPRAPGAVLVRGTLAVHGIPHFPANAISALYGEYKWGNSEVRVWVVQNELYLSADWSGYAMRFPEGLASKVFLKAPEAESPGVSVFALREEGYWAVLELPSVGTSPKAFLSVFSPRLQYFVSHARRFSDVSLPAILEIP